MKNKIEFTEEQAMLLESAQSFCEKESPISSVRNQFLVENHFDEKRWQSMAELGWLSITIPEEFGGLGLSLSSVVPVMESMGRQLLASPFLATTLATQAFLANANEVQKAAWLPKIATGTIATLALQEESGDWNLQSLDCAAELKNGKLIFSSCLLVLHCIVSGRLLFSSCLLFANLSTLNVLLKTNRRVDGCVCR